MKPTVALLVAAAATMAPTAGRAAPLVMENFGTVDVPEVSDLPPSEGQGFSGAWVLTGGANTPNTAPINRLSYTLSGAPIPQINGPNVPDESEQAANTLAPLLRPVTPPTETRAFATAFAQTGTVWISALVRFNAGTVNNNDTATLDFSSGAEVRFGIDVAFGSGNPDFVASFGGATVTGGMDVAASTQTTGTYFLVARLNSNGAAFTSLDLWVNPTYADLTGSTNIDATAVAIVNSPLDQLELREDNLGNGDAILWDRIVIGDSLSLVIPELGTYAAIVVVALLAGATCARARARLRARRAGVAMPSPGHWFPI